MLLMVTLINGKFAGLGCSFGFIFSIKLFAILLLYEVLIQLVEGFTTISTFGEILLKPKKIKGLAVTLDFVMNRDSTLGWPDFEGGACLTFFNNPSNLRQRTPLNDPRTFSSQVARPLKPGISGVCYLGHIFQNLSCCNSSLSHRLTLMCQLLGVYGFLSSHRNFLQP